MGCAPSKNPPMTTAEANRQAMERNQQRGKDRMGHDHGIPDFSTGGLFQGTTLQDAAKPGGFHGL